MPAKILIDCTFPEPVAKALATAAAAQQTAALHRAGHYAALADTGRYSDVERVRWRELASEFTLIAEHMQDALEILGADYPRRAAA